MNANLKNNLNNSLEVIFSLVFPSSFSIPLFDTLTCMLAVNAASDTHNFYLLTNLLALSVRVNLCIPDETSS
jgi:hypothetical protein